MVVAVMWGNLNEYQCQINYEVANGYPSCSQPWSVESTGKDWKMRRKHDTCPLFSFQGIITSPSQCLLCQKSVELKTKFQKNIFFERSFNSWCFRVPFNWHYPRCLVLSATTRCQWLNNWSKIYFSTFVVFRSFFISISKFSGVSGPICHHEGSPQGCRCVSGGRGCRAGWE